MDSFPEAIHKSGEYRLRSPFLNVRDPAGPHGFHAIESKQAKGIWEVFKTLKKSIAKRW
jgi:hypothetical protein